MESVSPTNQVHADELHDVVVVGAGLAGLAAAWRLRHWDVRVLEAGNQVGGRIRSERRGQYWLNWGGHVFAGAGSCTDALFKEIGVEAVTIPGSLKSMAMNGALLTDGRVATYPFRIPLTRQEQIAILTRGARVGWGSVRYALLTRRHAGESRQNLQQRVYDFEDSRTFADLVGTMPGDAGSLFEAVVTRSAGDMDQISAGCGIGYFSLVFFAGKGLNRGVVGGPSTMTESIAAALGDRICTGAVVQEVEHQRDRVVVRYLHNGVPTQAVARTVILACTADVSHTVGVDLPSDVREALGQIVYGPHVSAAFLTDEDGPRPWDASYGITTPQASFAIALNQASIVRGTEKERQPGGSIMTFSPASKGRALLDAGSEQIVDTHLADLDRILGHGFADSVVEARSAVWEKGSPYRFPGRGALQPALMRSGSRVMLAGDYLGTLYTETAISTGFSAAQNAAGIIATDRVR